MFYLHFLLFEIPEGLSQESQVHLHFLILSYCSLPFMGIVLLSIFRLLDYLSTNSFLLLTFSRQDQLLMERKRKTWFSLVKDLNIFLMKTIDRTKLNKSVFIHSFGSCLALIY